MCIRLYVIGKEDRAEETHQGCVFVQVSLAENEVFRQAESLLCSRLFCMQAFEHGLSTAASQLCSNFFAGAKK